MPKAAVLAGVKRPRIGPGSVFSGQGNHRAWASGVGRFHSGESPKGYYSNVGVQALAAWVRRFVPGNRLNARSTRRSRFGVGRAWESTGMGVRRWSRRTSEITGDGRKTRKQTKKRSSRPPVHFMVRRRLNRHLSNHSKYRIAGLIDESYHCPHGKSIAQVEPCKKCNSRHQRCQQVRSDHNGKDSTYQ